jgi:predicted O-linked N-acetylglucosamine transferase (SPINDLY family)
MKLEDTTHNFKSNSLKAAKQIQNDAIDILIDLDSIDSNQTCQIIALKSAPIQITWLGYDASGIPAIDYFLADNYVVSENAQNYYQEKIWPLPNSYLCVDGFEIGTPTLKRSDLGIPDDAVIYLTAQTGMKRHPDNIRVQIRILANVPDSYLLIKGLGDSELIEKLFQEIAISEGVDISRLRFLGPAPTSEIHRANLKIADVVLDTYPYNGATTTLEVLWMEIPLVTRVGQQFAARNSYTFMVNAGLREGIAWTEEEYLEWGIKLGTDAQLRQRVREKLRKSKQVSPLWNAKNFTKDVESAYLQMWANYCKQEEAN